MRIVPFLTACLLAASAYAADVTDPKALLPLCRALAAQQSVTLEANFSALPADVEETLRMLGCSVRLRNGKISLRRDNREVDADKRLEALFAKLLAPRTRSAEALTVLRRIEDLLLAHTPSEKMWKRIVEEWIPMARIKYRDNGEVLKELERLRRALRPDDLGWS